MGPPAALVELAVAADAAGWDGVFLWDHVHFIRSLRMPVMDPWVVLGAMAARTERVRLGTLVTPVPRRRPWKLAKEVMTLDHLSGGRAVLGVGLGYPPDDEFAAFGEDADGASRAERLDEGLALIDAFLRGEPVVLRGKQFDVDAELLPAAVQSPRPPIWVGAMWPNRRPVDRAFSWDGIVPMSNTGGLVGPEVFAELASRAHGEFDVVATQAPGVPVSEYAAAGATWLLQSAWPQGEWADEFGRTIAAGPPVR